MGRTEELEALNQRARRIEARIHWLNERIGEIENRPRKPALKAVVDTERCVGCGICRDQCPEQAVSVNGKARIDPQRCTGCGRCIDHCPRGALSLSPVPNTGSGKIEGIKARAGSASNAGGARGGVRVMARTPGSPVHGHRAARARRGGLGGPSSRWKR